MQEQDIRELNERQARPSRMVEVKARIATLERKNARLRRILRAMLSAAEDDPSLTAEEIVNYVKVQARAALDS